MALQAGNIMISGTIGDLTYYKMGNTFFARWKTRIDKRMFWNDRRFEGSRQSCKRFAEGNKLASQVYRSLPKEQKKYERFCQLKSAAIIYLKEGHSIRETIEQLQYLSTMSLHFVYKPPKFKKVKRRFLYAIEVGSNFIHLTAGRWLQLQRTIPEPLLDARIDAVLKSVPITALPLQYRRVLRA